jgi:hypothetical protein
MLNLKRINIEQIIYFITSKFSTSSYAKNRIVFFLFNFQIQHKTQFLQKALQTLVNRQFSKIISRLANGKVYIYTLANCQVGDFTVFKCEIPLEI